MYALYGMLWCYHAEIKTTMGDVVVIESEDSENSILEVEVPKKPTPPLINIDDEEIILNIMQGNQENFVAKDFIEKDKALSVISAITGDSQKLNSPNHWTTDMIKFYDDDWGDEEHFIVEKIQEKMDKTPSLWNVATKDVLSMQNKARKSNIRCWNCNQRGHHFSLCPDPPHVPKCHMCGSEGHLEYGCPNSKCLNCGNRSREFVTCCYKCRHQQTEMCSRCRTIGHNFINCPDHWRLFHMTTGTTSVTVPDKNIYKSNRDIWCCNCGKQGHYHIQCTQRKNTSAFMDTLPFVISYQKAFKDPHVNNNNNPSVMPKKRQKGNKKQEVKMQKTLRLNPLHKAINKDKLNLKNTFMRLKMPKRNRRRKKGNKGLLGPLIL